MRLRYNYRLYPDENQREALARTFGCARVVYNDGLSLRKKARQSGSPWIDNAALSRLVITQAKQTPDREWLGEVSAIALQQSLADLNTAYKNFFDSVSGRRSGPKAGLPTFRSRKDARQSFRLTRGGFRLRDDGSLFVAKIGELEVRWSRPLPSTPSSVTVVKDPAGRYFASFVVEVEDSPLPRVEPETGVDLGLTHYAVLSDGTKIGNPRLLRRRERKLKGLQRELTRKQKGSANHGKARRRVARQHAKVADARQDFLHKLTITLIRDNQALYVEDLAIAGLARTRLAKSVHDASWGVFVRLLEQKAARYGRVFGRIDRWHPSTKLCACCGHKNEAMPLDVREWDCPRCGEHHDRDVCAAINVLAAGLADRLNACGGQIRPGEEIPTLAPPAAPATAQRLGGNRKRPTVTRGSPSHEGDQANVLRLVEQGT